MFEQFEASLNSENSRALKVSELTRYIKEVLEGGFTSLSLEGEISNFRPSSTGHWYFSLKDEDAVISAVLFRNRLQQVNCNPVDGMRVIVRGSLSVYEKRGTYQIVCESLEEAGQGRILQELEERKRRLAGEGLFSLEHKKTLPLLPRKIAVISSPTGAALRDILQVLKRRASGLDVVIVPVPVQGQEAGVKIARAVELADRLDLADVIIVARGGGSLEDLLPFSEEAVVRAIAACKTPVISAVGHEIDTSLSDLAADLRAPTPSAAAELVAASREDLYRRVMDNGHFIAGYWKNTLHNYRLRLNPYSSVRMEESFRGLLQPLMQELDDAKEDLLEAIEHYKDQKKSELKSAVLILESLSPWEILERGYAAIYKDGKVLGSAKKAQGNVQIRWKDGIKNAHIIEEKGV